jgi:hypothetical protein
LYRYSCSQSSSLWFSTLSCNNGFYDQQQSGEGTVPGVWVSFTRYLPVRRVVQYNHSPSQKTTGQKYERVDVRGKKNLARLASGFVF